ncbi:MAG: hypothetical protein ACXWTN_06190 [Methylosarcina sp.]
MSELKHRFSEKSVGTVLIALTGPLIVWGLHFGVVYSAHHLACTLLSGHSAVYWAQWSIIIATVIALLALLLLIVKPYFVLRIDRDGTMTEASRSFLPGVMRMLALLSYLAVLYAGGASFFIPACESIV